jgi:predicted secreted Zn-dependent protease
MAIAVNRMGQKERCHPEHVDGEEQHAKRDAGLAILDDPDSRWCRDKRHRRVQDNAEQQGIAPDRVESVQPLRFLLDIRHGRPSD